MVVLSLQVQVKSVVEAEQAHGSTPKKTSLKIKELLPLGCKRFDGRLSPRLSLAFAMCTHSRLGTGCLLSTMPPQLLKRVIDACTSQPDDKEFEISSALVWIYGTGQKICSL